MANFKCCLIPTCNKSKKKKKLCVCVPEVAGICSYEAVDVQTDVGQGEIEDKEVTGIPHLLHSEEGHDADGIEEESEDACGGTAKRLCPESQDNIKHLNPLINIKAKVYKF